MTEPTPVAAEIPGADPADPARGGLGRLLRRHSLDTRPLRHRAYRRLLVGQGTAFVGSMLTQTAVPVQVYSFSHSSLDVGFVGLAGLVPIVVFGLYGGAIADVVDRRRLYLWSSVGTWLVTFALLAQTLLNLRDIPLILGLVFLQGAAFAIASSTRGAIIPRIVDQDEIPAANTLTFTVTNVGQVVGPLIAGVLLGLAHGYVFAYAADAVLFTAALYSAFRLPTLALEGKSPTLGLRSVLDGLAFIATRPVLIMSFGVDLCAMVLAQPRALFPQIAADRYAHARVLGAISPVGALYASVAFGSILAGLSSGWIGRVKRQGVALTIAVVGWGACVALAGLAHQLWLVLLLLTLAGAADLVSSVYRQTILQTYAPDEMRGRMQGVFVAVVAGGPRLGDVRAGATATAAGATFAWTGGGIACVVVVLVAAVLVRPFWRYDASARR